MIKTFIIISIALTMSFQASTQSQAETYIKEAQAFLAQKNYAQAQLSLQDAINDINAMIGQQIAEALPDEINGLKSSGEESNTAGMGMMGGGMSINKTYRHPTKNDNEAEVHILANSPMLAAMNMALSNPAMMGSDYKSIRVGTRRAILKSEMQGSVRDSEIQIPLSQTLITINARGFASEAEELAFAGKLDIEKLKVCLGEN